MQQRYLFLLSFVVLTLLSRPTLAQTTIRYVSTTGTAAASGATTWANSTTDLQGAINASATTDQVWVAAGLYKPTTTTDRSISFTMKNGVAIYGGFVGNETLFSGRPAINPIGGQPSSTTLSGEIGTPGDNTDNSSHVIYNPRGLTSTAMLDGFVITGGYDVNGYLGLDGFGGGMYNNRTSPSVTNCLFINNTAGYGGGGMANVVIGNPSVTNCSFQANSSPKGSGGGMYNEASKPSVTNCLFVGNSASSGGAMHNRSLSDPSVTNCSFQANSARSGGAILNFNRSNCSVTNCSFQANSSPEYGGGAMYNTSSDAMLTNCVLFNNGGNRSLYNSNDAYGPGTLSVSYSLFDASVTGYGSDPTNFTTTTSPFASPTTTQLVAGSPAIDAGSSAANGYPTDLAGNPRIVGCRIDLGAYELQATASTPIALISQPPAGSAVCPGGRVTVSVSTTGTVTGYQWYKDGQVLSPAQPSASLSLADVQPTDAGSYSLVITGACNSVTSTAFSLTVNTPVPTPFVVTQSTPDGLVVQISGGVQYERIKMIDRINGYEIRQTEQNSTGYFLITQRGPYSITVIGANGCRAVVTGTF